MRTDKELQEGVVKALDWEPSVNAAQIGVTVQRGVVTLTGQVGTLREKWIAEKTARHVWGCGRSPTTSRWRQTARRCVATPRSPARGQRPSWNSAIPPDLIRSPSRTAG
jgi:hypothetical protein